MPRWHAPEGQSLDEAVDEVLATLDLADDPTTEEVIGMTSPELVAHAVRAIAVLANAGQLNMHDPNMITQLYCLGFVVGMKYGQSRSTE